MTVRQLQMSLSESAKVLMVFTSLSGVSERMITDLPFVCEFPKVFPNDINDFPPEREVEFVIDLVPSVSVVPMAPYKMSALELSELKKQLEDLLENKFVRSSVSLW